MASDSSTPILSQSCPFVSVANMGIFLSRRRRITLGGGFGKTFHRNPPLQKAASLPGCETVVRGVDREEAAAAKRPFAHSRSMSMDFDSLKFNDPTPLLPQLPSRGTARVKPVLLDDSAEDAEAEHPQLQPAEAAHSPFSDDGGTMWKSTATATGNSNTSLGSSEADDLPAALPAPARPRSILRKAKSLDSVLFDDQMDMRAMRRCCTRFEIVSPRRAGAYCRHASLEVCNKPVIIVRDHGRRVAVHFREDLNVEKEYGLMSPPANIRLKFCSKRALAQAHQSPRPL